MGESNTPRDHPAIPPKKHSRRFSHHSSGRILKAMTKHAMYISAPRMYPKTIPKPRSPEKSSREARIFFQRPFGCVVSAEAPLCPFALSRSEPVVVIVLRLCASVYVAL